MTTNDFTCNLVSLGKTGVGKSALLNYLFNLKFESGVGNPVTPYGLHEENAEVYKQKIRVFDSWGIEPDKVEDWKRLIRNELIKHGSDKAPEEWFHAVLYCVQAGGGRLEKIDEEIILQFINEGYHVIIVITKIDQFKKDQEKEREFREKIHTQIQMGIDKDKVDINDLKLEIVSVCSEDVETRSYTAPKSGKDELIKTILNGWIQTTANRFAPAVTSRLKKLLEDFFQKQGTELEKTKINVPTKDLYQDFENKIKNYCNNLIENVLPQETEKLLESFDKVNKSLEKAFNRKSFSKLLSLTLDKYSLLISSKSEKNKIYSFITLGIWKLINKNKIEEDLKNDIATLCRDCTNTLNEYIDNDILPQLRKQIKECLKECLKNEQKYS